MIFWTVFSQLSFSTETEGPAMIKFHILLSILPLGSEVIKK